MSLHIQIEKFEGPIALLLYLIRKEEMDIFDINIHHITQQYLEYIKAMKKLDLEVAGEFVAMAATLIHIKSRLLLPQYNEHGEEVEVEDPRKQLVQKLLEYEKYQEASKVLYDRPLVGRDVFLRGQKTEITSDEEDEILVEENPLFSLIRVYRAAVKNIKNSVHRVLVETQSIAERVKEMSDRLIVGQTVLFTNLLDKVENNTNQVLITFLSFLELTKLGYVSLYQSKPLADIYIKTHKPVNEDAIEGHDAYSYVIESNIMENRGAQVEVDLSTEDLEYEETEPIVVSGHSDEQDGLLEAGEAIKDVLTTASDEADFKLEAATDEEILAEEKRLNLASGAIVEPEGEVEI